MCIATSVVRSARSTGSVLKNKRGDESTVRVARLGGRAVQSMRLPARAYPRPVKHYARPSIPPRSACARARHSRDKISSLGFEFGGIPRSYPVLSDQIVFNMSDNIISPLKAPRTCRQQDTVSSNGLKMTPPSESENLVQYSPL